MMKKIIKSVMILLVLLLLVSCTKNNKIENQLTNSNSINSSRDSNNALSKLTQENYPRVDGSTATMPLMAATYSKIFGVPLEDAETYVNVTTTTPAWRNLLRNQADLLIVYEAPETVKKEIKDYPAELLITPIGRDGLVFLTNMDNKADGLSQQQIKDIFTGKTKNWNEVGGDNSEIIPFQRDNESGSQTLFLKLLMKDIKPMDAPTELQPADMGALIEGVSYYDGSGGAIGYSVFYYAKQMYSKPNLKLLEVDGVAPSIESIGDGTYPLVNDFYVVIRASEPEDSPTRTLYNWLLSDNGVETIKESGYAPIIN